MAAPLRLLKKGWRGRQRKEVVLSRKREIKGDLVREQPEEG